MERSENQTCITCHFLCDKQARGQYRDQNVYHQQISQEIRDKALKGGKLDQSGLACYFGVFEKGIEGSDIRQIEADAVNRNRRGECFWRPYIRNMSFEAAKRLMEIELADRQAEGDRSLIRKDLELNEERLKTMLENLNITRKQLKLSTYGLWIVGIASAVQIILKLIEWLCFS